MKTTAIRVLNPATDHERRVISMMEAFGQNCPAYPTVADYATRRLRVMLLLEEVLEYAYESAVDLVFLPTADKDRQVLDIKCIKAEPVGDRQPNLPGMVDALGDISVVNVGAFVAHGVRMTPVLEMIDANNLLKYSTGSTDPVSGKFIKAPNHPVPDIRLVLTQQGWEEDDD